MKMKTEKRLSFTSALSIIVVVMMHINNAVQGEPLKYSGYNDGTSNVKECQKRCENPWPHSLSALVAVDPLTFDPGKPTVTQAIYPLLADCCDRNQTQSFCTYDPDNRAPTFEIPDNLHSQVVCDSDEHTARVHYCANTSVDLADKLKKEFGHGDNFLIYSFSQSTTFVLHWHLEASHREYATYVSTTRNSYSTVVRSPHDPNPSFMLSDVAQRKIEELRHVPLNGQTLFQEYKSFFQDLGIILYRRATMGCRQSGIWMLEQDKLSVTMRAKLIEETERSFLWFMHSKHVTIHRKAGAASWFLSAGLNVTQCIGGAVCGSDWHTWEAKCALEPDFVGGNHPIFVSDFVQDPTIAEKLQRAEYAYLLCGSLQQWVLPELDRYKERTTNKDLLHTIYQLRSRAHAWKQKHSCIGISLTDQIQFGQRLYQLSQNILNEQQ